MKTITEMAREAGAAVGTPEVGGSEIIFPQCLDVQRFAALVRADEREACAAQLDFNAQASSNGGDEYIAALLWQEAEEIRARGNT
jgi:hypothetical protein